MGRRRDSRQRSRRWEDGRVGTAAALQKRLLERVDFLTQSHVLVLHTAQFSPDRIDEPVAFCDIALERGDVLYSS